MIFVCKKGARSQGKGRVSTEKRRRTLVRASGGQRWMALWVVASAPGVRTEKISAKIGLRRIRAAGRSITIEAGNEWPVHIAVVVLLAVEESRGERSGPGGRGGNTCAGGEPGTCGAKFDRTPINAGD
jgi:hypothetical protein